MAVKFHVCVESQFPFRLGQFWTVVNSRALVALGCVAKIHDEPLGRVAWAKVVVVYSGLVQ
jgi:hypothetical protein